MSTTEDWIKKCEGYNPHPYVDTTGHVTIGWGHNMGSRNLTMAECQLIFDTDLSIAKNDLEKCAWYHMQPPGVQNALINMCFNLGIDELCMFNAMIKFLEIKDYTNAAKAALESKWAKQVGQRAKDVALMISLGK
jgi:lysozyme